MKKGILFSAALMMGLFTMAQSSRQVSWTYTVKKIGDKTYEVQMAATIGQGFHMYAQNAGGDGPIATHFTFTKNPLLVVNGEPKEVGKLVQKFETAWGHDVRYYENSVVFVEIVKTKGSAKANVSGKVEFMVCNDHECLPPAEVPFSVAVGG